MGACEQNQSHNFHAHAGGDKQVLRYISSKQYQSRKHQKPSRRHHEEPSYFHNFTNISLTELGQARGKPSVRLEAFANRFFLSLLELNAVRRPFHSRSALPRFSGSASHENRELLRLHLSFINFQRFPPCLLVSCFTPRMPRGKELFIVPQIYPWQTYFYGQQKIYYFDLASTFV